MSASERTENPETECLAFAFDPVQVMIMDHIAELKDAAASGKLVVVLGAGVSLSIASPITPAKSWTDLLRNALIFANEAGHVDDAQHKRQLEALNSGDMDELLGAAQFVSRKLGSRKGLLYGRWLEDEFSKQKVLSSAPMKSALIAMCKSRIPLCTLNYDTLIERATKSNSIAMNDPRSVLSWARRERSDILHLHGLWSASDTVVLGISDYEEAVNDEFRTALQQSLALFNRLVFIGCGDTLYDPNFSSLLHWLKDVIGASGLQHYALVRDTEVEPKLRDSLWQGLVRPIGYGPNHENLPNFIVDHLLPATAKRKSRANHEAVDAEVIQSYRKQIILESGKMTIEGVRADADTAKQKFELEKLFVPLSVRAVPPEYAPNDPDKEEKLKEWLEENSAPLTFGDALRQNDRLALLALPGGGKTLLLKRLAVAYADPERHGKTGDRLPEADLLPLLIRCREWRNYITLPISTMISRMAEITGNKALSGLLEALSARLKSGRILLLVDGLDEIHSDSDRCIFVSNLENFLDENRKVKLVVTSREAGFALVAPALMRFCSRWRIAPLTPDTIKLLCSHWHALMGASIGSADDETRDVVEAINQNGALQRLAENPLLLTMLLVVKHGYGRLPPDRVTLYERAVEVLLDTWNIHGHAALNPREAVPQIAYVAFRLMQQGRQTATESELLALIEECRREVPLVRLYAKDSPSEFLKRVELRSSLILEAGKSSEGGKIVSFYQFRHLTFQEYMAAIASVEGHYAGYREENSSLFPIKEKLLSEEWKEVVPMAAVLAKKRASAIINELLSVGEKDEADFFANAAHDERYEWGTSYRLPSSISRLMQCLVEEAEVSQENLDRSARLISTFAHGCRSQENWAALMRGPFGQTVFDEAWRLFVEDILPKQSWIRNTVALMAALRKPIEIWVTNEGTELIRSMLVSDSTSLRSQGAAIVCGIFWHDNAAMMTAMTTLRPYLEANVIRDDPPYSTHAIWALGMLFSRRHDAGIEMPHLSAPAMDKLKSLLVASKDLDADIVPFTFSIAPLVPITIWSTTLTAAEKARFRKVLKRNEGETSERRSPAEALVMLFYYARITLKPDLVEDTLTFRSLETEDVEMLRYFSIDQETIAELLESSYQRHERMRKHRLRLSKP